MNEFRIMFLRNAQNQPVGCCAIRLVELTKNQTVAEFQLSVLNPHDRFDRAVARQLAIGRAVENPFVVSLPNGKSMHYISEAVMTALVSRSDIPSRAHKAAKLWLSKLPAKRATKDLAVTLGEHFPSVNIAELKLPKRAKSVKRV